jgi:nitrate reductase NapD
MSASPVHSRRDLLSMLSPSALERGDDGNAFIHIASLLVQVIPHKADVAREAAAQLPGAELHETPVAGKFVVVLESGDDRAISAAARALLQLPGVLTVSIVAHLTELAEHLHEDS